MNQVPMHPKTGASWEEFALEEVIRDYRILPEDCYFWSSTSEAELDLLFFFQGKKLGFEFKFTDSPKVTASTRKAMKDLELDRLTIIVAGEMNYRVDEQTYVCGLVSLINFNIPLS